MPAPKFAGNIFHREGAVHGSVEGDNSIREGLAAIKIGDPGTREDRDFGVGPMRANGFERGNAHDSVADPICGADKELHCGDPDFVCAFARASLSRMVCQSDASSLKRKAILQNNIGSRFVRSGVKS